jgi:hypothetical protein
MDVDYRLAAIAALLPDMVDKPLSLTLLSDSGTSQGLAHTAVGQAGLVLTTATIKPEWLPYALITASHLVADQMWKYPRTLFFPFSGELDYWKQMGTLQSMLSAYAEIATRPAIVAVELIGLGLLGWVVRKGGLHRKHALKAFLLSGRLNLEPTRATRQSSDRRASGPERSVPPVATIPDQGGVTLCAS